MCVHPPPERMPTFVDAIRRGLEDKRSAHAFAELIGRVGKEIGGTAADDARPVVFHFHTNLNPMALAGSAAPRSPAHGEPRRGVGAPSEPAHAGKRHGRARRPAHRRKDTTMTEPQNVNSGAPSTPAADVCR